MFQVWGAEIWAWQHGTMMKKWEEIAATLSALPEFRTCEGVKAASCKDKWQSIVNSVKQVTGFESGEDRQSGRSEELSDLEKTVLDCLQQSEIVNEEKELIRSGTTRLQSELNDIESEVLSKRKRTSSPASVDGSRSSLESSLSRVIESAISPDDAIQTELMQKQLQVEEGKLQLQMMEVRL